MHLDSTAITGLFWIVVLLHIAVAAAVLFARISWSRKALWLLVVCSVPLLGPLYYLLFRPEWDEAASLPKNSKEEAHDPIDRNP